VSEAKIEMLCSQLGADADRVQFADMAQVGRNPARIIPAWRAFVAEQAARGESRFRGIGEPIWPGRTPDELAECERHESLLNLAFAGAPAWWLVCPYDTEALPPPVIEEAHRNHPSVLQGGRRQESASLARPTSSWPPMRWPPTACGTAGGEGSCGHGGTRTGWSARSGTGGASTTPWPDGSARAGTRSTGSASGWRTSCAISSRSARSRRAPSSASISGLPSLHTIATTRRLRGPVISVLAEKEGFSGS
jgi:hypothetical protein